MKKTGKILFSMAAAGAVISAAAFAVKKYNGRCGKPVPDMEPDDGFWEEYFPGQEESVPSESDAPGSTDMDGEENTAVRGIYLHKCELKQAILVKLLYGTRYSGFFGIAFFLTNNVNTFYL